MENIRDINKIIAEVKNQFPKANVWQIEVTHPTDDNGIWFFWLGEKTDDEIHVENSYGQCPFYMETFRNDEMVIGNTIEETVAVICEHLRTSKYNK